MCLSRHEAGGVHACARYTSLEESFINIITSLVAIYFSETDNICLVT